MTVQRATIVLTLLAGALFAWAVPLVRLFEVFQPIIVAASIMIAAILVRLNRGMPTLDWKSLEPERRERLTASIVDLSKEYIVLCGLTALLVASLIGLTAAGKQDALCWSAYTRYAASSFLGALGGLCTARMAYVVWRDYDIVKLQKALIDASGTQDQKEREEKASSQKIADIRSAGLRRSAGSDARPWE